MRSKETVVFPINPVLTDSFADTNEFGDIPSSIPGNSRSFDQLQAIGKSLIESSEVKSDISHAEEFKLLLSQYGNHPEVRKAILDIRLKTFKPSVSDSVAMDMGKEFTQYPLLDRDDEIRLFTDLGSSVDILNHLKLNDFVTADQEKILIKAAIAHHTLMVSNLRMVLQVAYTNYYPNPSMSFEDIIQEGNIGLFSAIANFDINMGVSFYIYARWKVRSAIGKAVRANARPDNIHDKISKLNGVVSSLEISLGRRPITNEIEHELPRYEGRIQKLRSVESHKFSSFDETVSPDSELSIMDADFDEYIDQDGESFVQLLEYRDMVEKLLISTKLDNRKREILKLRFGLEDGEARTLEEIGQVMNITRERVRQILERCLSELKLSYFNRESRINKSNVTQKDFVRDRYEDFFDREF